MIDYQDLELGVFFALADPIVLDGQTEDYLTPESAKRVRLSIT